MATNCSASSNKSLASQDSASYKSSACSSQNRSPEGSPSRDSGNAQGRNSRPTSHTGGGRGYSGRQQMTSNRAGNPIGHLSPPALNQTANLMSMYGLNHQSAAPPPVHQGFTGHNPGNRGSGGRYNNRQSNYSGGKGGFGGPGGFYNQAGGMGVGGQPQMNGGGRSNGFDGSGFGSRQCAHGGSGGWNNQNAEELSKTNLYIKGLEQKTTDKDLLNMCCQYGKIVSTKAVIDSDTNQCKGYGFVDFETQESARHAIKDLQKNGYQVQFAKVKQQQDMTNVYFANLPMNFDDANLKDMCSQYGKVISTRVLKGNRGLSRGIGFARMETTEECKAVIDAFNDKQMPACPLPLVVKFADAAKLKQNRDRSALLAMPDDKLTNGAPMSGYLFGNQPSHPQMSQVSNMNNYRVELLTGLNAQQPADPMMSLQQNQWGDHLNKLMGPAVPSAADMSAYANQYYQLAAAASGHSQSVVGADGSGHAQQNSSAQAGLGAAHNGIGHAAAPNLLYQQRYLQSANPYPTPGSATAAAFLTLPPYFPATQLYQNVAAGAQHSGAQDGSYQMLAHYMQSLNLQQQQQQVPQPPPGHPAAAQHFHHAAATATANMLPQPDHIPSVVDHQADRSSEASYAQVAVAGASAQS